MSWPQSESEESNRKKMFLSVSRIILKRRENFWYMLDLREQIVQGELERMPLEELRELNRSLYGDILPENYENSYGNPAYACKVLGETYGVLLSSLYGELRGMIVYAYEDRLWDFLVCLELFLQVYSEFEERKSLLRKQ